MIEQLRADTVQGLTNLLTYLWLRLGPRIEFYETLFSSRTHESKTKQYKKYLPTRDTVG